MVLVALNMVLTAIIAGATARVVLGNHIVVACKKKRRKKRPGGLSLITKGVWVFGSWCGGCMMLEKVYRI